MAVRTLEFESHHVLFHEAAWTSNPEAAKLRSNPGLVIPMYVAPHDELHNRVSFVPLLDAPHVFHINQGLRGITRRDPLGNIQRLLQVIQEVSDKFFSYDEIRLRTSEIAILAIEQQVSHIDSGLYRKAIPAKDKRGKVDTRQGRNIC